MLDERRPSIQRRGPGCEVNPGTVRRLSQMCGEIDSQVSVARGKTEEHRN